MAAKPERVISGMYFRFTKTARFVHWLYVACFAVLLLTGLLIFADFFDFLAPLFGGFAGAQLIHRIVAVIFILPAFVFMIFDHKSFFGWLKEVFTWKKEDLGFFVPFVKELLTGKVEAPPPQGFINAGEKINSMATILFTTLIILSGFIIWFPEFFPIGLVQWGYAIHAGAVILATTVALVHAYLGTGLWPSAIKGMMTGYVDEHYARSHHEAWHANHQEWYDKHVK